MNDFGQFWARYPRHVGKKDAEKVWIKIAPTPELAAAILSALDQQSAERDARLARKQWVPEIPYPATWLRGERWMDETTAPSPRLIHAGPDDLQQFKEEAQRRWDLYRMKQVAEKLDP